MELPLFGIQEWENQYKFLLVILVKYLQLNFNLVGIYVEHLQLIKLADCGISALENAWLFLRVTQTRF
jgi:hypothetical protein